MAVRTGAEALSGLPNLAQGRIRARSLNSRQQYLAAAVLFLGLTLVFFNPLLRGFTFSEVGSHQTAVFPWRATPSYLSDGHVQTDQADTYHPWNVFITRTLRSGSIPLWNPESFAGQPFLANGQSGTFYPLKLALAFLVTPDWMHDLLIALSVFLGGLAMFALLKEYGCGFLGASLAGITWMFNANFFAWAQFEIISPIIMLMPLAVLCVHRSVARQSWMYTILAATSIGMMYLGSSVLYILLIHLICLVYLSVLSLRHALPPRQPISGRSVRPLPWRTFLTAILRPTLLAIVPIGICAIQFVPIYLLSHDSGRAPIPFSDFHTLYTVPPSVFFLNTFRQPALPLTFAGLFVQSFIGLPTALFAIIGLFQRRSGATFARWLALAVFLVSADTPATWLAYHLIPGFSSFRGLGRGLYFWIFSLAILAGIGLDACLQWVRSPREHARGWSFWSPIHRFARRYRSRLLLAMRVTAVCAILITGIQLGMYARRLNPPFHPRQPAYLYPETPLIRAIAQDRDRRPPEQRQRIIAIQRSAELPTAWFAPTMVGNEHMVFGFESAGGVDSIFQNRTLALWRVVRGEDIDAIRTTKIDNAISLLFQLQSVRFDLLPRLGVTTIVTPPSVDQVLLAEARPMELPMVRLAYTGNDGLVYDIDNSAPRAYVVHHVTPAASPEQALSLFTDPSFDFRHTVVLERPLSATDANPPPTPTATTDSAVPIYHGPNDVSIEVDTDQPGWLVLNDMWSPDWHATIDGHTTAVLCADYTLRAVAVPAGHSRIEMRYRPVGFFVGAAVTAGTVGVLSVLCAAEIGLRRRRPRQMLSAPPADGTR